MCHDVLYSFIQCSGASFWVMVGNIESLINSFNAALWVFYGLVFVGLLIMRVTHRNHPRPYKVIQLQVPVYTSIVWSITVIFCTCTHVGVADLPYLHGGALLPTCSVACDQRTCTLFHSLWSHPTWSASLHFHCHGVTMEIKTKDL